MVKNTGLEPPSADPDALPDVRNAVYLADGRIDCEVKDPDHGWVETTLSMDDDARLFGHAVGVADVAAYMPPPPPSHLDQRSAALARVDLVHADFLRQLTGSATVEERDTWKVKEDAARALVAGVATDGQRAMLDYEAVGGGIETLVLAQTIISKAEAFQKLIGLAAGVRMKARGEIAKATDDQIPIEQVSGALDDVFAMIAVDIDTAMGEWNAG